MKRVAVGGLHTECSTWNPVRMQAGDFRILRGPGLLAHPEFALLAEYGWQWAPLLHARAIAGGPIARPVYDAFKAEFLAGLQQAGPLDALYLAMHGAAHVDGLDDAEGDWIEAARDVVGSGCPVVASYDLHGNVSRRVLDQLDIFAAYRTAPHIDVDDTKRRALSMLDRHLRGGPRPHVRMVAVPVLLPGERTSTEDEPAASLYARLPSLDAAPGIADASIMVGYVWADEPRATAAVVVTGTDPVAMDRAALELARAYWDAREDFAFGSQAGSVADCLDWADAAGTRPTIIAESGDNPTGGGVGDRAEVLAALLARDAQDALVAGIADLPATEQCYAAGAGARVALRIGATLDPSSTPVTVEARVVSLLPAEGAERQAVLCMGGITAVLTARRRPFHDFADFECLGLDPRRVRLLVLKSGYLSPDLAPVANPSLLALSPGVVDQHVERLAPTRIPRPTFPFDRNFNWTPRMISPPPPSADRGLHRGDRRPDRGPARRCGPGGALRIAGRGRPYPEPRRGAGGRAPGPHPHSRHGPPPRRGFPL